MGLIEGIERDSQMRAARPGPMNDFWYGPANRATASGTVVSEETALRHSAVFACVNVLAQDIGKLPLILYRRVGEDGKERAKNHPLYRVLRYQPNASQPAFNWREMLQGHLGARGNAFSEIRYGRMGEVAQLIPLRPDRMTVELLASGRKRFIYRPEGGGEVKYSQDELFHVPGFSTDGIIGLSPIGLAREAIGLGMAYEEYSARFFQNNASPAGALVTEQKLTNEKRKENTKAWNERHQGIRNAGSTAVLDAGLKWESIGISGKDAQFIEQRQFQVEDIARFYRMPLHKIGHLLRSTNNNIEHQALEYVTDTLMAWTVRWESAIEGQLLSEDEQEEYFVEFLVDALLRGDTLSRYQAHSLAIASGWRTRNEVRVKENENPLPGLDEPLEPLNMTNPGGDPQLTKKPPQRRPEPEPEPDEEARFVPTELRTHDAQEAAVLVLVSDVAGRIASAEVGQLGARADKAAQDRPRFNAWAAETYYGDKLGTFISKAVHPMAAVVTHLLGTGVDAVALTERIISDGMAAVQAAPDVPALLTAWRNDRAAQLGTLITEAIHAAE